MQRERLNTIYSDAVIHNEVQGNDFISGVLVDLFLNKSNEILDIFFDNGEMSNDFNEIVNYVIDDVREGNEEALWSDISTDDELIGYTKSFIIGIYTKITDVINTTQAIHEEVDIEKIETTPATSKRSFSYMGDNRLTALGNPEETDFNLIDVGRSPIPLLEGKERVQELDSVSRAIDDAFNERLESIYHGDNSVQLLKAPTGSGKTSRVISKIVSDPRTYEDMRSVINGKETTERRPIIILMPNHQNISEAVARAKMLCLDADMSDMQLAEALVNCGFCENIDIAYTKTEEARSSIRMCNRDKNLPPLNISVMESRVRAGCKKSKEMFLLKEAGISQSSMCQSRNRNQETGQMEDVFCEYYNTCPFIEKRQQLPLAHIIFMPHAYLTIEVIPDEIKKPRLVVIDERIQEQVLKYEFIKLNSLMEVRQRTLDVTRSERVYEPKTEEERDKIAKREMAKIDFERKEDARSWCAHRLFDCALLGKEPANFFMDLQTEYEENNLEITHGSNILPAPLSCLDLALDALTEIGKRDPRIKPGVDIDILNIICSTPGASTVNQEKKLWETIRDRILRIHADSSRNAQREDKESQWLERIARERNQEDKDRMGVQYELDMNKFDETYPLKATGDRDMRTQFLEMRVPGSEIPERVIRISWRENVNWNGFPVLLLDASAYEDIVQKIWPENPIITKDVVSDFGKLLNVRIVGVIDHAWSNSSLLSSSASSFAQRVSAGIALSAVRDATSVIASAHADGRVLLGSNKSVRSALQHNWIPPMNMDTCHYGAIRGIDVWKYHAATMSVGRMDLPIEAIDAMAACLTWDEQNPEIPFNRYGNGFADVDCQKPLFQPKYKREIRMRDGQIARFSIPMVEGKWGQLCQQQAREEELLQFLGRLRPIYRQGKTPIHYAFSSIIPEGLILDDCVTIHDIIGDDNSELLKKDKREMKIQGTWKSDREEQAILTRILDTAIRIHDGILCPEILSQDYINLDVKYEYRSSEAIFNLLSKKGFNLQGLKDEHQSMADGWSVYGYSIAGDMIKPVWVASSLYKTEEETLDSIVSLLVGYLNCSSEEIEIGPYHIIYPEKDVAQSMDIIGPELLDNAETNVKIVNRFIDFMQENYLLEDEKDSYYDENNQLQFRKTGKVRDVRFIREQNCEDGSNPYHLSRKKYNISEDLAQYMAPNSLLLSPKRMAKDKQILAKVCSHGLYYHQLMGVLSLQDIFGPTLEDIQNKVETLPGLRQVDSSDLSLDGIKVDTQKESNMQFGEYQILSDITFDEFESVCINMGL